MRKIRMTNSMALGYPFSPSKTWKTFTEPEKYVEDVVEDVRIAEENVEDVL